MTLLQFGVKTEERIAMAVSGFGVNTRDSKDKKAKNLKIESSEVPTAAGLFNAKEKRIVRRVFVMRITIAPNVTRRRKCL